MELEEQAKGREDAIAARLRKKELEDKKNAEILAQWEEEKERDRKMKESKAPVVESVENNKIRKIIRENDEKLNKQDEERRSKNVGAKSKPTPGNKKSQHFEGGIDVSQTTIVQPASYLDRLSQQKIKTDEPQLGTRVPDVLTSDAGRSE